MSKNNKYQMFLVYNEELNNMRNNTKEKSLYNFIVIKNADLFANNQIFQINRNNKQKDSINVNYSNLPTKVDSEEKKIIVNEEINKCSIKNEEREEKEEKKEEEEEKKKDNEIFQKGEIKGIIIEEEKPEKKKCGRKRERDGPWETHDKFSDDNLRRKTKHIALNELLKFINKKIFELYNGNIGKGMTMKKLLTIKQDQKANSIIEFNKQFLNKNLGEIFSEDVTTRYTNFPKFHNRILIQKLINEDDVSKRLYFQRLFNLTFLESLQHFRGSIFIEELSGLINYKDVINKYDSEEDGYKSCLDYYINNYEMIINSKKKRKSRKNIE
jgi:hypothetical protein